MDGAEPRDGEMRWFKSLLHLYRYRECKLYLHLYKDRFTSSTSAHVLAYGATAVMTEAGQVTQQQGGAQRDRCSGEGVEADTHVRFVL